MNEDAADALIAAIEPDANGCLIWPHRLDDDGYARRTNMAGHQLVHRYAWSRVHGRIPDGGVIRHTCDVRACVNAEHLLLGTHADNMQDQIDRGRRPWQKETDHR